MLTGNYTHKHKFTRSSVNKATRITKAFDDSRWSWSRSWAQTWPACVGNTTSQVWWSLTCVAVTAAVLELISSWCLNVSKSVLLDYKYVQLLIVLMVISCALPAACELCFYGFRWQPGADCKECNNWGHVSNQRSDLRRESCKLTNLTDR